MKCFLPRFLLALTTLCAAAVAAEEPKFMARAPGSEFGAVLTCTIQYAHEDVWNHTASETGFVSSMVSEVVPGQQLDVVLAFGGATADRSGRADVVYEVRVTKPNGTETVAAAELVARRGPAPDPRMVSHPDQLLTMAFSAQDAPGTYRIAAIVKDRVGKVQVTVSQEVRLLADTAAKAVPAGFDENALNEWTTHYYQKPDPRMALSVLQWIAHDKKTSTNPNAWPPLLGLYEMILRDNPWLVPTLTSRIAFSATPTEERATLLYVLAYVYRDNDNFALQIPESDREYFQLARHQHWPDPSRDILEGGQLDVLWGRFFATGAYAPIQALVGVLSYHNDHGKRDAFNKLAVKPARAPIEVYRDIVFSAALWSLKSNAKQHALVRDYCGNMLKNYKGTDSDVRVLLAMIVEAKIRTSDGQEIDLSKPPSSAKPAK